MTKKLTIWISPTPLATLTEPISSSRVALVTSAGLPRREISRLTSTFAAETGLTA